MAMKICTMIRPGITSCVLCFVLIFGTLFLGCSHHAYEGSKLPKSEIAWLIGGPMGTHKIWFFSVDEDKFWGKSRIAVLPGRHKIKMRIEIDKFVYYGSTMVYKTWDFEAGHKYKVIVDIEPGISNQAKFTTSIKDVTK